MLTADFLDVSKFRVYSGTRESWPFESSASRAQVLTFRVEYESSITRFLKLMLEHFSSPVFFTEPSRVPGYLIACYSTTTHGCATRKNKCSE